MFVEHDDRHVARALGVATECRDGTAAAAAASLKPEHERRDLVVWHRGAGAAAVPPRASTSSPDAAERVVATVARSEPIIVPDDSSDEDDGKGLWSKKRLGRIRLAAKAVTLERWRQLLGEGSGTPHFEVTQVVVTCVGPTRRSSASRNRYADRRIVTRRSSRTPGDDTSVSNICFLRRTNTVGVCCKSQPDRPHPTPLEMRCLAGRTSSSSSKRP